MSYRPKHEGHTMNTNPLLWGARYVTCKFPGCMHVRRAWNKRPLVSNGGKP